jgi:hypothetical protein
MTQQLKCFPACQIQAFIGVHSNSSQEFSGVIGSREPQKIISEDEELMCE